MRLCTLLQQSLLYLYLPTATISDILY